MSKQLVVLLSRQRSGTNAYRAVVDSSPEIHCFEEVLNPDDHYLVEDWSYFNYIESNCTVNDLRPKNQLNVFSDFVDHLHNLHDKPRTLIDLKINTCGHVSGPWRPLTGFAAMPLFNWLKSNNIHVIRLRRDNYLRVALSNAIANHRQKWHDRPGDKPNTDKVNLKLAGVSGWFRQMKNWQLEDKMVSEHFEGHNNLMTLEYSAMYPRMNQPIISEVLEQTTEFLGFDSPFSTETWCRKSTSRPMWESIENWGEVSEFLKNTEFAPMLEDEPSYRGVTEFVADEKRVKLQTASSLLRRFAA